MGSFMSITCVLLSKVYLYCYDYERRCSVDARNTSMSAAVDAAHIRHPRPHLILPYYITRKHPTSGR